MFATVHLTDRGVRGIPSWIRHRPRPDATAGLRSATTFVPAPLGSMPPRPQVGRLCVVGFWDDRDAAAALSGTALDPETFDGLVFGLEPVRAVGTWPGLPPELPSSPARRHDGDSVVITLGRLRMSQAVRFFRASAVAERHILASAGLTWATGLANPVRRTVATLSWWHDHEAMSEAARGSGGHREAMAEQNREDFHHESAFVRFAPVSVHGSLDGGRNPFAPGAI